MAGLDHVREVAGPTRWIVAVVIAASALARAPSMTCRRPTRVAMIAPASAAAPSAASGIRRAAAPARRRDTDCAQAMPADGQGGCYAAVAIASRCAEPVNDVVEHIGMSIAGTSRTTGMVLRDMRAWRISDRFVARLQPLRTAAHASAAAGCRCGERDDGQLAVIGLLPLDPEDTRTVAQVMATKPELWDPWDVRWRGRAPERQRWAAVVTPERGWNLPWFDLHGDPPDVTKLGPVPETAKVGDTYIFVGGRGEQMHLARDARDRAPGFDDAASGNDPASGNDAPLLDDDATISLSSWIACSPQRPALGERPR